MKIKFRDDFNDYELEFTEKNRNSHKQTKSKKIHNMKKLSSTDLINLFIQNSWKRSLYQEEEGSNRIRNEQKRLSNSIKI